MVPYLVLRVEQPSCTLNHYLRGTSPVSYLLAIKGITNNQSMYTSCSCSEVFLKEVAVNIQHCAVSKNEEQCSKFRFIIAKCSQEVLPYRFKEQVGIFNSHTKYGTIKLKQFSVVGETAPADTETRCTAFMFYKDP